MNAWTGHGTKILGAVVIVQNIIGGLLAIPDLIHPGRMKYWLAANVILGAFVLKRGFTNTRVEEKLRL